MKHTDDTDKTEAALAFDERLASTLVPTEDIAEIRAIGLGNAQTDSTTRTASQPELLTERPLGLGGEPIVAPSPARRRRAPRQSRNHKLLDMLKELTGEQYAEFIVVTRTAVESGMRCQRWKNKELLYDALPILADIAGQVTCHDESDDSERIELAMRRHEKHPSVMSRGATLALPHQYDVHDATLGITLRIHFTTDVESCQVIVGWIEEIRPGDHTSTADNQDTAGHNALACA